MLLPPPSLLPEEDPPRLRPVVDPPRREPPLLDLADPERDRLALLAVLALRLRPVAADLAPPASPAAVCLARVAVEREALLRLDLVAVPDLALLPRDALLPLRLLLLRPEDEEERLAPPLLLPAKISPDRTFCAASATASAIREPNRATELPALLAVSAASAPASRIFLRTLGEALIAAAAAARPAASISLLIAALASLSMVSSMPPLARLLLPFSDACEPLPAAPPEPRLLSWLVKLALPPWLFDLPLLLLPLATLHLPPVRWDEDDAGAQQFRLSTSDKSKATVTWL